MHRVFPTLYWTAKTFRFNSSHDVCSIIELYRNNESIIIFGRPTKTVCAGFLKAISSRTNVKNNFFKAVEVGSYPIGVSGVIPYTHKTNARCLHQRCRRHCPHATPEIPSQWKWPALFLRIRAHYYNNPNWEN